MHKHERELLCVLVPERNVKTELQSSGVENPGDDDDPNVHAARLSRCWRWRWHCATDEEGIPPLFLSFLLCVLYARPINTQRAEEMMSIDRHPQWSRADLVGRFRRKKKPAQQPSHTKEVKQNTEYMKKKKKLTMIFKKKNDVMECGPPWHSTRAPVTFHSTAAGNI